MIERVRRWLSAPRGGVQNTSPGGTYVLVLLLALPLHSALESARTEIVIRWTAIAVFGALYLLSQTLRTSSSSALRYSVFVAMAAVSLGGLAVSDSEWVVTVAMTAAACANLLPLVWGAGAGIGVLVIGSVIVTGQITAGLITVAAGAIAVLRGRLLIEIEASRDSRKALARAAVENERLRISRDLHDLLGHSLAAMVVTAEVAERLTAVDPVRAAAAARDVQRVGREAMVEVGDAVTGYRKTSLASELTRARSSLSILRGGVHIETATQVWSAGSDAVLGWGVREGTANVLRHADATHCSIVVEQVTGSEPCVQLVITNDDAGGRTALPSTGHGLAGLAERAQEVGGSVDSVRLPSGDFRLIVKVPIADETEGDIA